MPHSMAYYAGVLRGWLFAMERTRNPEVRDALRLGYQEAVEQFQKLATAFAGSHGYDPRRHDLTLRVEGEGMETRVLLSWAEAPPSS